MDNKTREIYYHQEWLEGEAESILRKTREPNGISLKSVSNVIKKVFDEAEVQSLIKELTE